jgi:PAS domain S-box-containing protein
MHESRADTEFLFREILDASPSFLHVLRGPEFIFEYANEAYCQLVGRRDLVGRPAFAVMPEAAGEYPRRIEQVMATRQPFHGRELPVMLARVPGAEPEERLIDLVYLPLLDAEGRCTRVLGHGTDVTENVRSRRRAERAERHSYEKLSAALAAGRMVAWEWNVTTDVLTGSGAWAELFHGDGQKFDTGKAALQHVHPDDRAGRAAMIRAVLAGTTAWHTEYRIVRADGSIVWLEERAEPAHGRQADETVVVGLAWDVSARRRAEDALRVADTRKNDFLATLSHELRNPLAPIRSGLQILKLVGKGEERLERTRQVMERQLAHLVRLIDDLMEVSRISRGKVHLRPERLSMGTVLSIAIEAVWPATEAKSLVLLQELDEPLVVHGDKDRLVQVFANLLNNAVKFSHSGTAISLSLRREADQAVVVVKDEGQGIDAASLDTVFDLFAQGPAHQMSGGLGIGLALVRQLVQLHGGSVEVQSEGRNRGSAFTVRLPLAIDDLVPLSQPVAREAPSGGVDPCLRVLVVDDNRDAADTLATSLQFEGHDVTVVYDGPSALDTFERVLPDVVILDIGMPDMDGYEVARRIRQSNPGHAVRILALTGWGQAEDRKRAHEAGFDEHLIKPVDMHTLKTVLSENE